MILPPIYTSEGINPFPYHFKVLQPASDRAARKAGRKRHRRDAASSRRSGLAGREQTQATFIEVLGNRFVALANRRSVDHTASV